jgi:hypothetical protein
MRRLLALLTVTWLAVAAMPAARAATTVINVSRRTTNQSETAVAASPLNADDVTIASNIEHGYGIFVAVSHNGGLTWSRKVIGDGDRFGRACCDPTITWDTNGNLFLSWLGYGRRSFPTQVPILLSTDAGDSWQLLDRIKPPDPRTRERPGSGVTTVAPRSAAADGGEDEEERGGFVDQPTITTGPHALWAIWNNEGVMQAAGARIRGLGDVAAFKPVRDIPNTMNCTFGDVAVGPGGAVAHVCQKDRPGSRPTISVLRFSVDADGLKPGRFTQGAVIGKTNVSLFEPIRPQKRRTVDAEVALAWILQGPQRGRLVMLFTDEQPDQSDDTDVFVRISSDAGDTWSQRIGVTTAVRSQFLPRLAMDPATGHLVVGWHDASLDNAAGAYDTDGVSNSDAMYALAFSGDGGDTWTAPQMVSDGASNAAASGNGIDFGDYTGLSFAFAVAHPAWADNSDSTGDNPNGTLHALDIYSAAVAET